eukprot:TCONS_00014455-protein
MSNETVKVQVFPKILTPDPKVDFVTDTPNATISEVILTVLLPLLSACVHAVSFLIHTGGRRTQILFFINEQIFLVLPVLLGLTIWSDYLNALNLCLFCLFLLVVMLKSRVPLHQFLRHITTTISGDDTSYISVYKAIIQLLTAFTILAVDFHIFPRRFAKSESFGLGNMDLGVGIIIMSMGLTSPAARGIKTVTFKDLLKTVQSSFIIILLGCIRLILVKLTNYQEHVSEYGLYWNFFFTLACVRIIASIIQYFSQSLCNQLGYLVISLCLILTYQFLLSNFGLETFLVYGANGLNARSTFVDANREGIFSLIGFLSLYFIGIYHGAQLFKQHLTLQSKVKWLFVWFFVMIGTLQLSRYLITDISRQMANLSYYFFIVAINSFLLACTLLLQITIKTIAALNTKYDGVYKYGRLMTPLFHSISRHQLLYFMLANVFTGLINKIFNTLEMSHSGSIVLLGSYMGILNLIVILISEYF